MSRIKIEDLPVLENLTAEEKELIFGAGRPSFRPMLESLENREMMDAGLGYGLQIPLAQSAGGNQLALVRQLVSETTQQVSQFAHTALESAQTAQASMRQAVIDQLFSGLGHRNLPQSLVQSMPQVPQGQQQALLAEGAVRGQINDVAKELLGTKVGKIESQRFDENTFVNNVLRQTEVLLGSRLGTHQKCMVERIDGGIKVLVYTDHRPFMPKLWANDASNHPTPWREKDFGRGEIWLTFKYDDAQLAKGFVKVSEIRQGFHYKVAWMKGGKEFEAQKWKDTGDSEVHAQIRDAQWNLSLDPKVLSNAVLEKAGNQLGADVLKWIKGKPATLEGGKDGKYASPINGHVESIVPTTNGLRVTISAYRPIVVWNEFSKQFENKTETVNLTFTLEHQGEVNGQQQFKVASIHTHDTLHAPDWWGWDMSRFGANYEEAKGLFTQVRV